MENKDLIIIALLGLAIYLYYQNRKLKRLTAITGNSETLFELDENLVADKDQAIRDKNEADQEVLSLSNKLKLKNQEVSRKDTEIERLKKAKSEVEIALNKKITELKTKYSKQGKLLDEEQLEYKKLEEKVEKLATKITELETERKELLTEINKHDDLDEFSA
jgi:chromosome segregation ATPase